MNFKEPLRKKKYIVSRYEYKDYFSKNININDSIDLSLLKKSELGNQVINKFWTFEEQHHINVVASFISKRIVFSICKKKINSLGDNLPIAIGFFDKIYNLNGKFLFSEVEFETIDCYYSPATIEELNKIGKILIKSEICAISDMSKYQRFINLENEDCIND